MTTLSDWRNSQYPDHDRDSCSDEHPINADIDGSGCRRCNAFVFQEHEEFKAGLQAIWNRYQIARKTPAFRPGI